MTRHYHRWHRLLLREAADFGREACQYLVGLAGADGVVMDGGAAGEQHGGQDEGGQQALSAVRDRWETTQSAPGVWRRHAPHSHPPLKIA